MQVAHCFPGGIELRGGGGGGDWVGGGNGLGFPVYA